MALLPSQNVVLVGMRASGKSTLGRELARRLQRPFVDLDDELARRAGRPADELLSADGEAVFRDRERDVLGWAATLSGQIIATGGGAVLHRQACQALASPSIVVYLELSAAELTARSARRPRSPLTDLPLREEVLALLAERAPLYRGLADITIPEGVPDPILTLLEQLFPGTPPGAMDES